MKDVINRHSWLLLVLLVGVLGVSGCRSTTPLLAPPEDETEAEQVLSEGYSLLHGLTTQVGEVNKILIIKQVPPATRQLIQEIASAARAASLDLATWTQADPRLALSGGELPHVEQNVRADMGNRSTTTLLSSSGEAFELQLLLTQESATGYAAALARQLAAMDANEDRRARLEEMAQQFEALNTRIVDRLALRPARN